MTLVSCGGNWMSFSSFIVLLRNMIMLCTTPHCPVFALLSDNWSLGRGLNQAKFQTIGCY